MLTVRAVKEDMEHQIQPETGHIDDRCTDQYCLGLDQHTECIGRGTDCVWRKIKEENEGEGRAETERERKRCKEENEHVAPLRVYNSK